MTKMQQIGINQSHNQEAEFRRVCCTIIKEMGERHCFKDILDMHDVLRKIRQMADDFDRERRHLSGEVGVYKDTGSASLYPAPAKEVGNA